MCMTLKKVCIFRLIAKDVHHKGNQVSLFIQLSTEMDLNYDGTLDSQFLISYIKCRQRYGCPYSLYSHIAFQKQKR